MISRRRFLLLGAALLSLAATAATGIGLLLTGRGGPTPAPAASGATTLPTVEPTEAEASEVPIESAPPPGPGRVARENQRTGTRAWELSLQQKPDAEGYAGDVSVAPGEPIGLHVRSTHPTAAITLYRLGWYDRHGARPVARWRDVPIDPQPDFTADPTTGLIRAGWSPAVTAVASGGWVSGLYLAVVEPRGGAAGYLTFVVREDRPQAPILFVSAATTHQAYNAWGGKSLYPDESTGASTVSGSAGAVVVSFDRPYEANRGAGLVLRWEYPFVRWLESRLYDVAYAADVDLDRHPELFQGRRLIVFAGHPEYWSVPMRDTLERAIAAGTSVAFFSANEMYWRIRFEDSAGPSYRSVTCYRRAALDPRAVADPVHATTRWREAPSARPESAVIGQMFGHVVLKPGDFTCSMPDHWAFTGTGMSAGDTIANLVGPEYDRYWSEPGLAPAGVQILATSQVVPDLGRGQNVYGPPIPNEPWPPVQNSTIYTAPSGATVFSAGTIQWSWGLDDWGSWTYEGVTTPVDIRARRITANILDRLMT